MSENTNTPNRIINLDSEYKIKIEKGNDFTKSIFADVYRQARQNVADILSHSKDDNKHDSYNNIIAFTGERGKGKSSTMISFLESLVRKDTADHSKFYTKEEKSDFDFSKFNFLTIDVIDPSLFRREEQLFEIIIAKLFSQFRKEIENRNGITVNDEDRRELVKLFQQVFENLKYIHNRPEIYKQDALDALIKLSTSSNLKENFDELIEKYLKVFGEKEINNFLVIAIDDFDLKVEGVFEMLEDIRQYFITKNIVILLSCKIEQLTNSLLSHFIHRNYNEDFDDTQTRVNKYISKTLPASRRIELSNVDSLFNSNITIRYTNIDLEFINYDKSNSTVFENNLRSLIFRNLNLFVPSKKSRVNAIFPTTLRELIEFLSFEKSTITERSDKLKNLKNYIVAKTTNSNLFKYYKQIDNANSKNFKLIFVDVIESYLSSYYGEITDVDTEKREFLFNATNDNLISIGDIASLLMILDKSNPKDENVHYLELYLTIQQLLLNVTFTTPEIYNGVHKILRNNRSWYFFKYSFDNTREDLIKRLFIHYLGNYNNNRDYRSSNDNPFTSLSQRYKNGVLTPLSILGNFHYFDILSEHLPSFFKSVEAIDLINSIKALHKNYTKSYYYSLLSNPLFLKEFINEIKAEQFNTKKELPTTEGEIIIEFGLLKFNKVFDKILSENGVKLREEDKFNFNLLTDLLGGQNMIISNISKLNLYIKSVAHFSKEMGIRLNRYRREGDITMYKINMFKKFILTWFDDEDEEEIGQVDSIIEKLKLDLELTSSKDDRRTLDVKALKILSQFERDLNNIYKIYGQSQKDN